MQAPTTLRWRVLRASVFAVLATLLAALAHGSGGGHPPDPAVLLSVALLVGGTVSGLADRRRNGLEITAMLAGSQLVFHLLFQVTSHGPGHPDLPRMVGFHLIAALASAWLMTAGERTLFQLFAALYRVLASGRCAQQVRLGPSWTAFIGHRPGPGSGAWLAASVSRRGPPTTA